MTYDPRKAAERWKSQMAGSSAKYTEGVRNVKVAPTQLAAQAVDSYVAGINEAVNSGRFQRSLNAVTLQDWQQKTIDKGAGRLATGAAAAFDKVVAFQQKVQPFIAGLQSQVHNMPSSTLEDRIQRMVAWAQGMHAFENK